jgi:UDP-N-acetylglucosamine--N-acetylmuramyl-(pentapeptide) pyrophosphoryl-undecaprenol N-acetylglucosamine transferase
LINFFTSPIGLGHATRDIAIAENLDKGGLLFVSGKGAADLLTKKGFKTLDVYSPEKFNVEAGQLRQSFKWLMDYYSYYKRCKLTAKDILDKHDGPIVSDEDFASIAVGEEMQRKRILVTDITETRFTSGAASIIEKKMNKSMKKMMRGCDCVIIPDIGDDNGNTVHVGPIVRQASAERDTLRKALGFSRKTIVLSIGGTDAGRYLIEKTVEAYRKIGSRIDAELVIVSGPSLKLDDSPEYRNLGFVENLHEVIYAADLVISLAGRSTMDESIAYGTPGIFIPIKGHFEQEDGASRLGFKYKDIFRLDQLIEEKISLQRTAAAVTGGAQKAAEIIRRLGN